MMRWPYPFLIPLFLLGAAWQVRAEYKVGGDDDCLMQHVPDADVAYQPGMDVHGNAVAPADLSPTLGAQDLSPVTIDFGIPLNNYVDQENYNADFSRTDILLDPLTVDTTDNSVKLGGHDLSQKPCVTKESIDAK